MKKRVFLAGVSGGAVMMTWLFVANAVLPFKSDLIHRVIPLEDQLQVHEAVQGRITETGVYSIPYVSPAEEELFPNYRNQPVFTVIFNGYTHGGGPGSVLTSLPVLLLAVFLPPILLAWLLSMASPTVLSEYWKRALFGVTVGMMIALSDDVLQISFGPMTEDYLSFVALNNIVAWTLTGLVIAGLVRPDPKLNPLR